jgi:chaperonin GroEL
MGLLPTKDGVTVAREIQLDDPIQNLGAKILLDACLKVNRTVGDGTTTTAVLSGALLRESRGEISYLYDFDSVTDSVEDFSIPIETKSDIEEIALIATNGDGELSEILSKAAMAVGKEGTIVIEDGKSVDSKLVLKEGADYTVNTYIPFLKGCTSRKYDGCLVAVILSPLKTIDDITDLLETATQWPQYSLIVFAPYIEHHALQTMVLNDDKGVVKCCAIPGPGALQLQIEYLKDIAALSGAVAVDVKAGYDLKSWNAEWFGSLREVTVTPNKIAVITYPDHTPKIKQRITQIDNQIQNSESDYDKDLMLKRKAALSGGIAVVQVGGLTEYAMKERRARVEDAMGTIRSVLHYGIVPGGGNTLLYLGELYPKFEKALSEPFRVLMTNGLQEPGIVKRQVLKQGNPWIGMDLKQGRIRDFLGHPKIVDATLGVKQALVVSKSICTTILNTCGAIVK